MIVVTGRFMQKSGRNMVLQQCFSNNVFIVEQ